MRDTCHHCTKNESVLSFLINPGGRVYPVCQSCFDVIRIGHELPHVAGPLEWAELPMPSYREINEPFETNDIVEVRRRYGPRPGDKE